VNDPYGVGIEPQFLADNRGEQGFMPLTRGCGVHDASDHPVRIHADFAPLHKGRDLGGWLHQVFKDVVAAAGFQNRGNADPGQQAVFARCIAAFDQLVIFGQIHRLLQHGLIITTVIFRAGRGFVRELVMPDQVAPPYLDTVHPKMAGHLVDSHFHHVVGRRLPEPAHRHLTSLVGGHRNRIIFDTIDTIGADNCVDRFGQLKRRATGIGSGIIQRADFQGSDGSVVVKGHGCVKYPVRPVGIATGHVDQTVLDEPHRRAQPAAQVTDQNSVLDPAFDAVRAAHIHVLIKADAVQGNTQGTGQQFHIVRHLDRCPDIQNIGAFIPAGQGPEGFNRYRGTAAPPGTISQFLIGGVEIAVHISPQKVPVIQNVAAMVGMHQTLGFGKGLFRVHDRVQWFEIHVDQFQCVLGNVNIVGHHNDDPFAHVPGHVHRQWVPSHLGQFQTQPDRIDVAGHFFAGDHCVHARQGQRLGGVNRQDTRPGVGTLQHCGVLGSGKGDILHEFSGARNKPFMFFGASVLRNKPAGLAFCHWLAPNLRLAAS